MRRQLNLNTTIATEETAANTTSCVERHDTMLKMVDGLLVSKRRPGLVSFADFGSGKVKGIYPWKEINAVLVVCGNNLYKVTNSGTSTLIGAISGSQPAIFAEFRVPTPSVLISCGDKIYKTDGTTVAVLSDNDAPQSVSHVAHFQQYALANQTGTEFIHYSDALDFNPETWAGELFSAEGAPDDVVAMHVSFGEIVLFGSRSVERYYNDGATPFVKIGGASIDYGCIAPYSIQFIDNTYFYLNSERKLVRLAGSQQQAIGLPIDKTISNLTTVSDAIGMHDVERKLYILTFPTENVTYVYDYVLNGWIGQWSEWNQSKPAYDRFRGNCMAYVPDWGKTLVGDYENGLLYSLNEDVYQDNGQVMRSAVISANQTGNQYDWLTSARLDILLKRGHGNDSPLFKMRYRQNGSKTWSNAKDGSIGNDGDTDYRTTFRRLGRYRSRQYEFYCTDNAPFTMIAAFEEVNG